MRSQTINLAATFDSSTHQPRRVTLLHLLQSLLRRKRLSEDSHVLLYASDHRRHSTTHCSDLFTHGRHSATDFGEVFTYRRDYCLSLFYGFALRGRQLLAAPVTGSEIVEIAERQGLSASRPSRIGDAGVVCLLLRALAAHWDPLDS